MVAEVKEINDFHDLLIVKKYLMHDIKRMIDGRIFMEFKNVSTFIPIKHEKEIEQENFDKFNNLGRYKLYLILMEKYKPTKKE